MPLTYPSLVGKAVNQGRHGLWSKTILTSRYSSATCWLGDLGHSGLHSWSTISHLQNKGAHTGSLARTLQKSHEPMQVKPLAQCRAQSRCSVKNDCVISLIVELEEGEGEPSL